jgi:hypothetical protein
MRDVFLTLANACMYNNDYHGLYECAETVAVVAASIGATLRAIDLSATPEQVCCPHVTC